MLINCLEVAGVDGTFRVVCELVMEVLRANRDSLMAVLEAFVHDPLFTWKLAASPAPQTSSAAVVAAPPPSSRSRANSALPRALGDEEAADQSHAL
jgi:FKBP12-rapamycin complex-associated protein